MEENEQIITINVKTLLTPEAHERVEEELKGFLYSRGIEAVIENSVTGNSTVSNPKTIKVDEEDIKRILKEYYPVEWEEMQEQGTVEEFISEYMSWSEQLIFLEKSVTEWLKDNIQRYIEQGEP